MGQKLDVCLTAVAPAVWGSTYIVTTQMLPDNYPLTAATLRALPAGLLLLLVTRTLPGSTWLLRSFLLGALNFAVFWWLLFYSAYALPGGVAATVGAIQPLIVLYLAKVLLDQPVKTTALIAEGGGVLGVALLVLSAQAALNWTGVLAALGSAVSMACGTVLSRKWHPPVPALTFAAWQLAAGGLLLMPFALWLEPALPPLEAESVLGFAYLSLVGGALTYILWFRGISALGPTRVAPLGLLSPLSATLLGWVVLSETLGPWQGVGAGLVLCSVWLSQRGTGPRVVVRKSIAHYSVSGKS